MATALPPLDTRSVGAAAAARPRRRRRADVAGWCGVALGAASLVWVFHAEDGLTVLRGVFERLGPRWPWLLVPYVLTGGLTVWAYRAALPGRGHAVPLRALVHAERSGFILNSLLPLANYGGNLAKVTLLRHWYSGAEILAAGAWGALATGLTNSLAAIGPFVALAVGFADPRAAALLGIAALLTAVPATVALVLLRFGLAAKVTALLRHVPRLVSEERRSRWLGRARDFDRHLASAVGERRGDFAIHVLLKALVQASRIAEVWLVITLLGLPGGLLAALLFHAVSRTTGQVLSFVPGQLGVLEGSAMLGFAALGFTPEDGLAIALALRFHFFVNVLVSGTALATASRVLAKYPPLARPREVFAP